MAQAVRAMPAALSTESDPTGGLIRQIVSAWQTQAIHAAVSLGVPDALAPGASTAAAMATELQCSVDGLTRLLRALCALGVCSEDADGQFYLASHARLLCQDTGGLGPSLQALVLWWGSELWPMWGDLAYSVRSGRSARERQTGRSAYQHLAQPNGGAAVFHAAMQALTALVVPEVARWRHWADVRHVVDVGGGHGQMALGLLAAHPALQATVFDQPHARDGALQAMAQAGMADRCRFVGGSFFDEIPAGFDCYLLKSILHNWNDEQAEIILARCRQAMGSGARLLLVERIRPELMQPGVHDEALARTDLNMLAGLGGRERTYREFADLLQRQGFEAVAVMATSFEFSLLEARPA